MKKIIALSLNDIRNIFREQILYFMFLVFPVLTFFIARLGLPVAGDWYPILADYYPLILLLLTLQLSSGIGFVIASIILDERDEGVLTSIRVMPMAANTFILYRILFSMFITFLTTMLMLLGTGIIDIDWWSAIMVSFLFSLIAPLVLLALPSFSQNKVEGLAFFKAFNLLLILPAASFFISSKISYLFALLPLYWTFHFFDAVNQGEETLRYLLGAVVVHVIWIGLLIRLFKRKVFMR